MARYRHRLRRRRLVQATPGGSDSRVGHPSRVGLSVALRPGGLAERVLDPGPRSSAEPTLLECTTVPPSAAAFLETVPLLSDLTASELGDVLAVAQRFTLDRGDTLCRQGD